MGARGPLPKAKTPKGARAKLSGDMPPPPSWLGDEGTAEFLRLAPVLGAEDFGTLADYCGALDEIGRHLRGIKREGSMVQGRQELVLNGRHRALAAARRALATHAAALGLTPVSRARMGEAGAAPASSRGAADDEPRRGPAAFDLLHGGQA